MQVIFGSLASSAPVRYHPFISDNTKNGAFYSVVTETFAIPNRLCPQYIREAFEKINHLYSSDSGRVQIQQQLRLCHSLNGSKAEHRIVNLWIENAFATLGMENYPYPIDDYPSSPLFAACNLLSANISSSNAVSVSSKRSAGS